MSLSAVVITLNEEENIYLCLQSLAFCDETIVVDSGSQDRTCDIAKSCHASVYFHTFLNFAAQKNFGILQAKNEWVLLVDADERVSEDLAQEILRKIPSASVDGYYLRRRSQVFGRWMKRGIHGRDLQLRLVRRPLAVFEGEVHERVRLAKEKTDVLGPELLHYSTPSISSYMRKLNHYTHYEAKLLGDREKKISSISLWLRPLVVILKRGVFQRELGEGMEGLIFCFLSAYYEFIKQIKYLEASWQKDA